MIAEHQAAILAAREVEHSAAVRLAAAELHRDTVLERGATAQALFAAADAKVVDAAAAYFAGGAEGVAAYEAARDDRMSARELVDLTEETFLPAAEAQCKKALDELASAQADLRKATGRAIAIDKLLPAYVMFRDAMAAGLAAMEAAEAAQLEISQAAKVDEVLPNSILYDFDAFALLTPGPLHTAIYRLKFPYTFDVLRALRVALALPVPSDSPVAAPIDDASPVAEVDNKPAAESGSGWRRGGRRAAPTEMAIGFSND